MKNFIRPKAEPYHFPDALTADDVSDAAPPETEEDLLESLRDELFVDGEPRAERRKAAEADAAPQAAESRAEEQLEFARVQAEAIVRAAQEEAEKLLADARTQAQVQADRAREDAQRQGYQDGYAAGSADAERDLKAGREAQAAQMTAQLTAFMESASREREQLLEETQTDMRDLAVVVAEKVIRISLKSSSGIIAKMIQDATEKMKRREWVHIYVSGCDAKGLAQITPRLTRALAAVSDHIRIIPMTEEEAGACIIETPDTIIDASVSTQMTNIRTMLEGLPADDASSAGSGPAAGR